MSAIRLRPVFDRDRLGRDVAALSGHRWSRQRSFGVGTSAPTDVDWRCLALRSLGGDGTRTDPGGPGVEEFADTEWLDRAPYLREVLASIPAPLRAVRLMALGPGAHSVEHRDTKHGPAWGVARLHVPVITNPGAILVLDGVTHRWEPGSFWFGDFSKAHRVANDGAVTRIHLVIDCLVVPGLAALFDATPFGSAEVLYGREAEPEPEALRSRDRWAFPVPSAFLDWESEDLDGPVEPVTVHRDAHGPVLRSRTWRARLVHVVGGEYRFAGWSEERTVSLPEVGADAVLRTRMGGRVREHRVGAA